MLSVILLVASHALASEAIKLQDIIINFNSRDDLKGLPFPPVLVRSIYHDLLRAYDDETETFPIPQDNEFKVLAIRNGETFEYKGLLLDHAARIGIQDMTTRVCFELKILANQQQESSQFYRSLLTSCRLNEPFAYVDKKGLVQVHQALQGTLPAKVYNEMIWNELLKINHKIVTKKELTLKELNAPRVMCKDENFDQLVRLLDPPLNLSTGNHLGNGAFGIVEGSHWEHVRRVAVKTVSTVSFPTLLLINEVLSNRTIFEDPHFVKLHRVEMKNFYDLRFTMDLLEGRDGKWIAQNRPIQDMRILAAIVREVLEGLQALHSKGWRHSDIKCDNIFITKGGKVKILDLGLASRIIPSNPIDGGHGLGLDVWKTGNLAVKISINNCFQLFPPIKGMEHLFDGDLEAFLNPFSGVVKNFLQAIYVVNPSDRPTIAELLKHPFLQNFASAEEVGIYVFGEEEVRLYLQKEEIQRQEREDRKRREEVERKQRKEEIKRQMEKVCPFEGKEGLGGEECLRLENSRGLDQLKSEQLDMALFIVTVAVLMKQFGDD